MILQNISMLLACIVGLTGCQQAFSQESNTSAKLDVVILGDSNTWIGGDNCDKPKGWNKWFKDYMQPNTCTSYARSGATWTNTSKTQTNITENIDRIGNDNVIYNQIKRLEKAVDTDKQVKPNLIIIAAGTNDAWFQHLRPNALKTTAKETFSSTERYITHRNINEVLTLAESVRYGCEMLISSYPDAQIVLLTPLQSTAVSTEQISKVGDIIEQCGHYLGINTIRQDHNCIDRNRELVEKKMTTDGTHTSEYGAKRNGYYIANQIKSILQPTTH